MVSKLWLIDELLSLLELLFATNNIQISGQLARTESIGEAKLFLERKTNARIVLNIFWGWEFIFFKLLLWRWSADQWTNIHPGMYILPETSQVAQHYKYVNKQPTPFEQLLEKEKSLSNLSEILSIFGLIQSIYFKSPKILQRSSSLEGSTSMYSPYPLALCARTLL